MGHHSERVIKQKHIGSKCAYCWQLIEQGSKARRYYTRGQHEPYVHNDCAEKRDADEAQRRMAGPIVWHDFS